MTETTPLFKRNASLDGLRGAAALSVVVTHLLYFPVFYRHLEQFPGNLLIVGHHAVILFFVLSGYVLTYQTGSKSFTYVTYLIKRFCRIYLPYLAVVCIAAALAQLLPAADISVLGDAWTNHWDRPITAQMMGEHIRFLLPFDTTHINTPIWSLLYELRISLIFPLIYFAIRRFGALPVLIAGAFASGTVSYLAMHKGAAMLNISFQGAWLPTVHYAFMFICGASLSSARPVLQRVLAAPLAAGILFTVSLGVYIFAHPLALIGKFSLNWMLFDWFAAAGAFGMIACLLAENQISRFFSEGFMRFLGRISFSLYLTHVVVVMAVFRAFSGVLSFWPMFGFSLLAIPAVAYASYRWLELPTTRLGYMLAAWARGENARVKSNAQNAGAPGA